MIQEELDDLIQLVKDSQPYYQNNDVNKIVTLTAIDHGYISWPFIPLIALYSCYQLQQEAKRQKQISYLLQSMKNHLNDPDLDHLIKEEIRTQLQILGLR